MLDGMVALASGRASRLGELYNEVPDRVSDTATLIGLGCAAGGSPLLGCLAACAAIFTAYVRAAGKAAGAPQEFCGPMAKQERMFLCTLGALWCGLAPASWQPAWTAIEGAGPPAGPGWGVPALVLAVVLAGSILTAARRLRRIAARLGEGGR